MQTQTLFLYILIVTILAAGIEFYSRAHKHKKRRPFAWRHYALFIAYPLALVALMLYGLGNRYVLIFAVSAVFGTVCEWLLGFYYQRIVGAKLWVYKRMSISGYTSWLIVPVWGFAGMAFAFLGTLLLEA